MKTWMKLSIAVLIALVLVSGSVSSVYARPGGVWAGKWQSTDVPGDGSINSLVVTYRPSDDTYRLTWRETFFTICGGRPGIGRGTGVETVDGLQVSMDFYCEGAFTTHADLTFVYDDGTDTFHDGMITWQRSNSLP